MERIIFCLIVGLLSISCLTQAQIQSNNTNASSNFNGGNVSSNQNFNGNSYKVDGVSMELEKPSNKNLASQTKLYKVCGNPNVQCNSNEFRLSGNSMKMFEESDLPFELKGELEMFVKYKSKPFYAIILKSRKVIEGSHPAEENYQECGGQFTEEERLAAQKLFPNNKVFTTAFGCVYRNKQEYTNADYNFNFMAVYGGERVSQANAVLKKARESGRFLGANVRKMQTIFCDGCH